MARPIRSTPVVAIASLLLVLAGCISFADPEPRGACIATCTGCTKLCWEDQARSECRERPAGAFNANKTCEQLGYTKVCGEGDAMRARPGTACPNEW